MKNYAAPENKKTLIKNYIKIARAEAFGKGYDKGWESGRQAGIDKMKKDVEESYKKGLEAAWNAASKIVNMRFNYFRHDADEFDKFFELNRKWGDNVVKLFFEKYSAKDAITKIKEFENEHKKQTESPCNTCIYFENNSGPFNHCAYCLDSNYRNWRSKEEHDAIESNVGSIKIGDEIKVVKDSRIIGAKGVVVNINNATLGAISSRGYFATWIKNVINTGYHYDIQSIFDDIKSHEREI